MWVIFDQTEAILTKKAFLEACFQSFNGIFLLSFEIMCFPTTVNVVDWNKYSSALISYYWMNWILIPPQSFFACLWHSCLRWAIQFSSLILLFCYSVKALINSKARRRLKQLKFWLKLIVWLGWNAFTWVSDNPNLASCLDLLRSNSKEYPILRECSFWTILLLVSVLKQDIMISGCFAFIISMNTPCAFSMRSLSVTFSSRNGMASKTLIS